MHYEKRRIWMPTPVHIEPEPDDDDRRGEEYRKRRNAWCYSCCSCCSGPLLCGLLLGGLVAGIGFAVLLTLHLNRQNTKLTCVNVVTTAPSVATSTTTQTTTSTSASTTTSTKTTTTTTASTTTTTFTPALNVNLVVNGDAETGPCVMDAAILSPTGWSFSGPITQIDYDNNITTDQKYSNPGPSNPGQCYFTGRTCFTTSMWQTIDLTNKLNPLLIDSHTIKYNLSAWLGGYFNQDDNAAVTLTFLDSSSQLIPNSTYIGPVLANDRNNISSLMYEQTSGLVPVGTRSMMLCVTLTRENGAYNNGNIDNIALFLY